MVLWSFVASLLSNPKYSSTTIVIYTNKIKTSPSYNSFENVNDISTTRYILQEAARVFNLSILTHPSTMDRIRIQYLSHCDMTDPIHYPRFTLFLQYYAGFLTSLEVVWMNLKLIIKNISITNSTLQSIWNRGGVSFKPLDILTCIIMYFRFLISPIYWTNDSFTFQKYIDQKYNHDNLDNHSQQSKLQVTNRTQFEDVNFIPSVIFDTAGYPLSIPIFQFFGFFSGAYIHYPIITYSMLERVAKKEENYNNTGVIASSQILSRLKIIYYKIFRILYRLSWIKNSLLLCNSTWTSYELHKVWGMNISKHDLIQKQVEMMRDISAEVGVGVNVRDEDGVDDDDENDKERSINNDRVRDRSRVKNHDKKSSHTNLSSNMQSNSILYDDIYILYPPCKVGDNNVQSTSTPALRKPHMISLSQFRPEKNHKLQIDSFIRAIDILGRTRTIDGQKIEFHMIGTVREQDKDRISELQEYIQHSIAHELIYFHFNLPGSELVTYLTTSYIGIHTMKDEHFGIGVVEMADGGLLTIAHDSAGPSFDILQPAIRFDNHRFGTENNDIDGDIISLNHGIEYEHVTGYLASDIESYAKSIVSCIHLYEEEYAHLQSQKSIQKGMDRDCNLNKTTNTPSSSTIIKSQAIRVNAQSRMRSHFSIQAFQRTLHFLLDPFLHQCMNLPLHAVDESLKVDESLN